MKTKTLSEREVWVCEKEFDGAVEAVTILPAYVFGEAIGSGATTSTKLVEMMLNGKIPALVKVPLNIVDVKDVALAHYRAAVRPEAAGRRFIVSGAKNCWMGDCAAALDKAMKEEGKAYKLPTG